MRRGRVAIAALFAAAVAAWVLTSVVGGDVDRRGAHVTNLTIASKAVGRELPVSVVVPRGARRRGRSLLVFLHGRDADERAFLDDEMFEALAELDPRAPIIAFPYGGDHSYWHDRADGAWGRYVTDEVVPQVTRAFHANPERLAIGGISMGGFGAFDLARLHPGRFCAVGGHSPALWETAGQTAAGAFDDAQDFARHDVVAAVRSAPAPFTSEPIWLDAGDADPFRGGDEAFVSALRAAGAPITEKTWSGGHEDSYWNSHWAAYLRFYARSLRACKR